MRTESSLYCLLKGKTSSLAELTKRKPKRRPIDNGDKPPLPPYCVTIPSLRPTADPELEVGMRVRCLIYRRRVYGEITPIWKLKLDSGGVSRGVVTVTHIKTGPWQYLALRKPVTLRKPS